MKVEASCIGVGDKGVAQTLRDLAVISSADMIVMGGYVHSRLRELVFGGVTRRF